MIKKKLLVAGNLFFKVAGKELNSKTPSVWVVLPNMMAKEKNLGSKWKRQHVTLAEGGEILQDYYKFIQIVLFYFYYL